MLDWLRQLFLSAQARSDMLEKLEQQAHAAKEQLNDSLSLACSSAGAEAKVSQLELAKSKFAQLQAIAAEHPRMRLKNEQEVSDAIKLLEQEFTRAGYYALAQASQRQSVSVHVSISAKAKGLLR